VSIIIITSSRATTPQSLLLRLHVRHGLLCPHHHLSRLCRLERTCLLVTVPRSFVDNLRLAWLSVLVMTLAWLEHFHALGDLVHPLRIGTSTTSLLAPFTPTAYMLDRARSLNPSPRRPLSFTCQLGRIKIIVNASRSGN
jgi:hypothetical protein